MASENASTTGATKGKPGRKKGPMSAEHKEALAQGRKQGKAIRAYLEAIESNKPRRGRKVTAEQLQERLNGVQEKLAGNVDPLARIKLIQERMDLENQLSASQSDNMLSELEGEFVKSAKTWAESQGVSYTALREGGVPASVLKAAGLERKAS